MGVWDDHDYGNNNGGKVRKKAQALIWLKRYYTIFISYFKDVFESKLIKIELKIIKLQV